MSKHRTKLRKASWTTKWMHRFYEYKLLEQTSRRQRSWRASAVFKKKKKKKKAPLPLLGQFSKNALTHKRYPENFF